jgi:transglutaminase-like putative cysteine protease
MAAPETGQSVTSSDQDFLAWRLRFSRSPSSANSINTALLPPVFVLLSIGCKLDLRCEPATPLLSLVHVHGSLAAHLVAPEQLQVLPDRSYEVLTDPAGSRWCRLVTASGNTSLTYATTIQVSDATDPVLPHVGQCPIQALPIDAYRFLNASTYCDTAALMELAWSTFAGITPGWPLVQAVCDWVHERIRFDYSASQQHQNASQSVAGGAGVCRDYAHLAITLCRCLNIPARYCTGYLGYTGLARGEAPVDFSAWFEVFLQDCWYVFDARHNCPRCGRVLIGRGRDAADVPFLRSFGAHELTGFQVITEEVDAPSTAGSTGVGCTSPLAESLEA